MVKESNKGMLAVDVTSPVGFKWCLRYKNIKIKIMVLLHGLREITLKII